MAQAQPSPHAQSCPAHSKSSGSYTPAHTSREAGLQVKDVPGAGICASARAHGCARSLDLLHCGLLRVAPGAHLQAQGLRAQAKVAALLLRPGLVQQGWVPAPVPAAVKALSANCHRLCSSRGCRGEMDVLAGVAALLGLPSSA